MLVCNTFFLLCCILVHRRRGFVPCPTMWRNEQKYSTNSNVWLCSVRLWQLVGYTMLSFCFSVWSLKYLSREAPIYRAGGQVLRGKPKPSVEPCLPMWWPPLSDSYLCCCCCFHWSWCRDPALAGHRWRGSHRSCIRHRAEKRESTCSFPAIGWRILRMKKFRVRSIYFNHVEWNTSHKKTSDRINASFFLWNVRFVVRPGYSKIYVFRYRFV